MNVNFSYSHLSGSVRRSMPKSRRRPGWGYGHRHHNGRGKGVAIAFRLGFRFPCSFHDRRSADPPHNDPDTGQSRPYGDSLDSIYVHFQSLIKELVWLFQVSAQVLCILTFIGKYRPLETQFPDVVSQLIPICERLASEGTPKQAKHAIRCLHVNLTNQEPVFSKILDTLKEHLVTSSPYCRTSIVTLGHLALLLPDKFQKFQIKNIVSRKIVKELLLKVTYISHLSIPKCVTPKEFQRMFKESNP